MSQIVRVNEIRYVGYGVPDLNAEAAFYRDTWGLREAFTHGGMIYLATQGHDEPYVVRLRQTQEKRIDIIALSAPTQEAVHALHEQVSQHGGQVLFSPKQLEGPAGGYGFRFFSPDGLPFEISSDVARGPKRDLQRGEGLPLRISHIVLHSPQHQAMVKFFTDALGFRISDWLGDFMCFLRCNRAHHRIAILPGPPCLNHVAYDMPGVDGMMIGISRLRQSGVDLRWGPGRHKAGNNTFSYFVTPGGFAVEYTAELEEVDFDAHVHQVHAPAPRTMDLWGIGTGGPQTMPAPAPDLRLFQPAPV